ncbi:PilC/PilY family type IV pilus protein [Zhongshania sp.]|jgi:Tfp pilus tip-associated adhesin PilY1|uniref:PilC/PilY family type IV pilus protein n=1 Tax=Zhongshania sp. TaxID=1971902 RepID=UPI002A8257EC|nr:PilC/PilY family type IV pilus protein [Zhongshania sp.]
MNSSIKFSVRVLAVVWFSLFSADVFSEDIDLFSGLNPASDNPPTVLLGWHSSANSNANVTHGCVYSDGSGAPALGDTVGGMEQCAIVNTMLSLKEPANSALLGAIKIGMMVFNQNSFSSFNNGTSLGNGNARCGYLMVPPTLLDSAGIDTFIGLLKQFSKSDLGNQSRLGDLIAESWAMLNGFTTSCSEVDYSSLASVATECRDAVLVYLGNATKETANVADGTGNPDVLLKNELTSAFGYSTSSEKYNFFATPRAVTLLNNSAAANNKYWGDEWTRFMNLVDVDKSAQSDRNVTTYSIAVYDPELEAKLAGEINFLSDLATEGGGKAFKVKKDQPAALGAILLQIFNEVQDVNSVFSSATLPVSANTQGTYLNQVFIAMFRPDAQAGPRWSGNVKQYQLGFDSGGNTVLTDATQDPSSAVTSVTNPVTGAIASSATSFWTSNAPKNSDGTAVTDWPLDGFWRNSPEGDAFFKDAPDGDLVEKGGAGQILRINNLTSSASRKVFTCNAEGSCPTSSDPSDPSTPSDLHLFASSNTTLVNNLDAMLGAPQSGGGATITVGRYDEDEALTTLCDGKNKKRICTITHDGSGGTNLNATYDKVAVVGAWNAGKATADQVCSMAAPCAITEVTATSFKVVGEDIPGDGSFSYTGAVIVELSLQAKVSQSAHGLSSGAPLNLFDCSLTGSSTNTYNTNLVTGTVKGSVDTVIDVNTYTVVLGDYALAESGVTVNCGRSQVSLTADNLVNWMRGDDIVGNESKRGPCPPESRDSSCPISVRGSIHGDVLHSRPAVINYGGTTGVVVYYGSNDGHFRAINGNQTNYIGGVRPGAELWSFVAPEFFPKLSRQYKDDPVVKYPTVVDSSALPRDYFFDGTTTVLQDGRTSGATAGKSYIYMSARRGGRIIYAMDVTNPAEPQFLWRLTSADVPELGQTWSQPRVAQIKSHTNPVLVFGAGYDPAEDAEPAPSTNSIGRGILIVDAVTGGVLWAALPSCTGVTLASGGTCVITTALTKSIPADITMLDRDVDGYIDRLYAADVGGNVWRVDLEANSPATPTFADFQMTKLAELSGTGNDARKFLFGPDVVPTTYFDAVVLSSGDREHPLYTDLTTAGLAYNVDNRFYMIMDANNGKSVPSGTPVISETNLVNQTDVQCLNSSGSLVACTDADAIELRFDGTANGSFQGYYINLRDGEKGVNAPLAVAGKVYFGTNQPDVPSSGSCTANLGNAGAYIIDLFTGSFRRQTFAGGGLPPSPIAGLVTIDGRTVPFVIGGAGPSPFDPSDPELDLSGGRKRTYFYFQ